MCCRKSFTYDCVDPEIGHHIIDRMVHKRLVVVIDLVNACSFLLAQLGNRSQLQRRPPVLCLRRTL
jgi:hypothetical protein